jgi:hypothetical protein
MGCDFHASSGTSRRYEMSAERAGARARSVGLYVGSSVGYAACLSSAASIALSEASESG